MVNKASKLLRLIVLVSAMGGIMVGISTGQQVSFAQVPFYESDPGDGGSGSSGWTCPVESYKLDTGGMCTATGCVKKCPDCTYTCSFSGKGCSPLMMCENE